MAVRFQKRTGLGKGSRLNVSKSGRAKARKSVVVDVPVKRGIMINGRKVHEETIHVPMRVTRQIAKSKTRKQGKRRGCFGCGTQRFAASGLGMAEGDELHARAPLETGEVLTFTVKGEPHMDKLDATGDIPLRLCPRANALTVTADGACSVTIHAVGRGM